MRKSTRRMRNVIIGLFVLLGLLILALFGVSYAAAILARQIVTSSSASPALTNNAGNTVRTAGARLPINVTVPGSNTGRLLYSHEYNDGDLHHRRVMSTEVDAHGRTLQVSAPVDNSFVPAPLAKQMNMKAEIAIQVCAFVAENNLDISMMFDPYQEGVGYVTATFKPETMNGCNDLSNPFGFNSDFEVTFKTGLAPTYWHIDCIGPIVPGGVCTVSRVFLIPRPPDLTAAENRDQSVPPQPQVPLPVNVTGGSGRRLAPGKWGSLVNTATQTWDSSKCPRSDWSNLPTTSNSPSNSAQSASIMQTVLQSLPVDPTASPKDQAIQACASSALCAVGFLVCSGAVFQASFWNNAASIATAMGQSFTQTMSPSNMRNFWNSFSGSKSTRCTTTYTWAVCGMNKLPVYTGNGQYNCVAFNTGDITAGANEIMQKCANSCEMLQWYYSWWQNYRVGSYSTVTYTNGNKPAWYDGANYRYSQDWCGAADATPCDRFYDSTYCGAGTGTYNGYHLLQSGATSTISSSGYSYATHPRCWGGGQIPLCTSPKIVLSSTC
jgi:hypothetical protein